MQRYTVEIAQQNQLIFDIPKETRDENATRSIQRTMSTPLHNCPGRVVEMRVKRQRYIPYSSKQNKGILYRGLYYIGDQLDCMLMSLHSGVSPKAPHISRLKQHSPPPYIPYSFFRIGSQPSLPNQLNIFFFLAWLLICNINRYISQRLPRFGLQWEKIVKVNGRKKKMLWLWRFSSSLCLWDRSFCVNISAPSFIPPHRITKFAFKYLDKKTADVLFFLLLLLLLLLHIILHLICISDSSSLHETQHDYLLTSCLVPRDWLFLRLRSLDAENMAVSNWAAIQPNSLFLLLLSNSRRKREKKRYRKKGKEKKTLLCSLFRLMS